VAATAAILLMTLALAGISGQTNRARRFEPDGIVLLVAYAGSIAAVAATS
jgi:hypothetical protein